MPVPVTFVSILDSICNVPVAEEIPAIDGVVNVKVPAEGLLIEIGILAVASSGVSATLKWSGPSDIT